MSEKEGKSIVLDGGLSENTMTTKESLIKLEHSTSDTETITDIQNYLDLFNKEIEANDVPQVQTNVNSESAYSMNQNVQYYYQTTTRDGQMIMIGEYDLQMMANINQNHISNSTQIALPNPQDKINDIPQIVGLGDGAEYQSVSLVQDEGDPSNYVVYVVKQNDKNEETSNVSMEISQGTYDPDVRNIYNFNVKEDPTLPKKQEVEDFGEKNNKTQIPKKLKNVTQTHMCNHCKYSTSKRYLLSRHMKSHSKERPHKCDVCERGFKTLTSLTNHVNTHTGTKPHNCRSCSSSFTTSGELVRHVRYKHTHEKPHKCSVCDYASVEMSKLRNHMRCHTGERPYQCPHCTYASPDTFKLKRHLRIHTGEKPYECDICFARFTQSNSLKTHRQIHSGDKPVFKCDHCPATCGRKTDLRIHVQKLHTSDNPIKCKRCGDTFPDRYQFKVHSLSHKGEKCFKCELCSYASMTQRHLESHMLIHTNEKPFQCDHCDLSFRQKQLLRRHHNLHHNPTYVPPPPHDKKFLCKTCIKSFRHKGNLVRHMENHMRKSTEKDRNTIFKQKLEYTDSTNEDESEEDTSIQPSGTEFISIEGRDGQQYVLLKMVELGGQNQRDNTSTSLSTKQVDQSSSPNQKDLSILEPMSVADVKEECEDDVENFFGF
ncbi:PREDICTED: transcriptional repressor CTCF-like isoform X2 [Diuraphis noxia]|uniref:transcriptional repressor CTCF-like isoform X2 n=1 Tax=Diuraphis noxia TaxID=143948 RepID=UPI0007635F17|nr:PREDICTED: transcriptional repressor CTCF-like isoform X2 [Diuraphis noxia]